MSKLAHIPGAAGSSLDGHGRLDSWKGIAAYFNRSERTVQRWASEEGLPVHRMSHRKRGTVFAVGSELDEWWRTRAGLAEEREPPAKPWRGRLYAWSAAAGLAVLGIVGVTIARLPNAGPSEASVRVAPLTAYPGVERYPAFSPDGRRVAFSWDGEARNNSDIYVKVLGADEPQRLTTHPRADQFPAWSPDGRSIVFCRSMNVGTNLEIIEVPAVGGPERKLGQTFRPALTVPKPFLGWTPDGKSLVLMEASAESEFSSLYLMSVASGDKRRLTTPPAGMGDTAPALSPDGRTLAFVRGDTSAGNVYLLSLTRDFLAQGPPRQLTFEKFALSNPLWTADGREILYASRDNVPAGLFRIPAAPGSKRRHVPGSEPVGRDLAITQKGSLIAFSDDKEDMDIWRMELSRSPHQIQPPAPIITSSRREWFPEYSPDGSQIAFTSDRSGDHELWVCRHDGSGAVQLTELGGRWALQARWSPDGRWIAFTSDAAGSRDVYVVPSSGGTPRRLTTHLAEDTSPTWSPDGRWVYFCSSRGGTFQVWKVSLAGEPAERITRHGGPHVQVSPDGRFLYYSAGWRSMDLWRAPIGGGEEVRIEALFNLFSFTVVSDGVYYFGQRNSSGIPLRFYRFSTGKSEMIYPAGKFVPMGLTVSPDRRFLVSGVWRKKRDGDLKLLSGFR
ncbi:MAG: hypothetical protein ACKV22_27270 [Bryobacteraceae bacterium]